MTILGRFVILSVALEVSCLLTVCTLYARTLARSRFRLHPAAVHGCFLPLIAGLFLLLLDTLPPETGGPLLQYAILCLSVSAIVLLVSALLLLGGLGQWLPDYRHVFRAVGDLAAIFDHEGRFVETNKPGRFTELFGAPTCIEEVEPFFEKAEAAEHVRGREVSLKGREGVFLLLSRPILAGGHLMGSILAFHDVTEEKALQTELSMKNTSLQEANRQLVGYVELTRSLETERERLRLTDAVLNNLMAGVENSAQYLEDIEPGSNGWQEKAAGAAQLLRHIYGEVRLTINGMRSPL